MLKIFLSTLFLFIPFFSSIVIHTLLFVRMYNSQKYKVSFCNPSSLNQSSKEIKVTYSPVKENVKKFSEQDKSFSLKDFRVQKEEETMPLYTDRWGKKELTLSQQQTNNENTIKRKRLESKEKIGEVLEKNQKKSKPLSDRDDTKSTEKTPSPFETLDENKWGNLLKRLENESSLRGALPDPFEKSQQLRYLNVPDSYVNRKRNYEDIATKDVFPTLLNIDEKFEDLMANSPETLKNYYKRNNIINKYRLWEQGKELGVYRKVYLISEKKENKKEPLNFSNTEQNFYFDQTISSTKEEQLADFFEKYIDYDPNNGDLPKALRRLYYKNIQRIAYSFNTDLTYMILDYYQENLNKEDFLRNTMYQANKLLNTKVMTETLFAIENIYEIQYRGLSYYFILKNLLPTLKDEAKNFKRIKALSSVDENYKQLLKDKKIQNHKDLSHLYYRKRIEIVEFMEKHTPKKYRLFDITFLKGMIYWQRGVELQDRTSQLKAVGIWNSLNTKNDLFSSEKEDTLYKKTLTTLTPVLKNFSITSPDYPARLQRIRSILSNKTRVDIEKKIEREKKLLWN